MGCSTSRTLPDLSHLGEIDDDLKISRTHSLYDSIQRAKDIIKSINKLSKKLLMNYYRIIDLTGACVFMTPSIAHSIRCLFYKISAELNGKIENAEIAHSEDPPYISLKATGLSQDTKSRMSSLFDFIIEVQSYKIIIRQLDKDTPDLFYLIYEEGKDFVSKNNKEKIKKAIDQFQQLIKVRSMILKKYKLELYLYFTRNEYYTAQINKFGEKAIQNNIDDIYKIALLNNPIAKMDKDLQLEAMYSNVDQAKKSFKHFLKEDTIETTNRSEK